MSFKYCKKIVSTAGFLMNQTSYYIKFLLSNYQSLVTLNYDEDLHKSKRYTSPVKL